MATNAPVWPGPALMVPITVDCLLVGNPDRNSTWALTGMNYYNLAMGLIPDAPPPLTPNPKPPGPGAHLMWTLPYALRHGAQQQSGPNAGSIDFPLVPNRWIVLRIQYGAPGTAPTLSAGVIQSDLLVPPNQNTISQYPNPDATSRIATLQIGGYVPMQDFTGPAGPDAPFLKAVGPGDLSWAVAYDDIRNVFSFYDALPQPAAPTAYTYSIIGWYAAPPIDPMYVMPATTPDAWRQAVTKQFSWSVGDTLADVQNAQAAWQAWQSAHGLNGAFDPSGLNLPPQLLQAMQNWVAWQTANGIPGAKPPLPQQTLCHGMVANVLWNGPDNAYGTGAPNNGGTKFPSVAVGNTAVEAIARWIAEYVVKKNNGSPAAIPVIERVVEAFQKGLLFELERDPVNVERQLHKARFNAGFSGKVWTVVRPESDALDPPKFSGQQTIPLSAAQTGALTALNALQARQNTNNSQLFTQRLELFAVQFKQTNLPRDAPQAIKDLVKSAGDALKSAVQAMQTAIQTLQQNIDSSAPALVVLLGKDYELRLVDLPACFIPNDPVVLVANAKADTKLAPPGAYSDSDTLLTRFTGQTIAGIETDYTGNGLPSNPQSIGPADLLSVIAIPQGKGIPKEVPDLWLEALFLDTNNAGLLATLYFQKRKIPPPAGAIAALTAFIQGQQTAPWNDTSALGVTASALAVAMGLQGVPPSKVAVEFRTGQPWTPIYVDWKVQWFPTSMDPSGQFADWALGEIDYEWTGTSVPQPQSPIIFQGRTVLNIKLAQDIARQIETFKDDPNYQHLDEYIIKDMETVAQVIGTFDIMTQSLGGFTQQLVTRMVAPNQQPGADLLGNTPVSFRPVAGDIKAQTPLPFFPIRSGHFLFIDLWVVDSYGQILRGKDPKLQAIPNLIRSQSMITPGTANAPYVQLPPRVAQSSMAGFTLLDADDDTISSNSSDLTAPICGWVMANNLDQSLMVFDAVGDNQGTVILVDTDVSQSNPSGTAVRWDSVPGSNAQLGAPPNLSNAHLQAFTTGLLQAGLKSGGQALLDLFYAIDSALWQIEPQSDSGNLAVLIGRPLAVARARLSLDLQGHPDYNQSWSVTGQYYAVNGQYSPKPPPFVSVNQFRFRVGDLAATGNGVLGYFVNGDYSRFYGVYGASVQTSGLLQAIQEGQHAGVSLKSAPGADDSGYVAWNHLISLASNNAPVYLTILMDPRGAIPVVSGSLPVVDTALAPGPVTEALTNMEVNFRVGPLLVEPGAVRMPIPAEIQGQWSWVARADVTSWAGPAPIKMQDAVATLAREPPRLREGWLTLSGAIKK